MPKVSPKIFKVWIHSHEEDTENVKVYRQAGYPFPPARGREGFEIKENKEFVQYKIGPDDRPQTLLGHWEAENPKEIKVSFKDPEYNSFTFYIESIDEEVLKIRN
jgi:hypothetical protein